MRIRQVKPAFWADSKMAELPEGTRLFYIGLWMLADDAGWLRWDAAEVAHELYGYETRKRRERRVGSMFEQLVTAKRVTLLDCGHAIVPHLAEHQRLAGQTRQVKTVENEHLKECLTPKPAPPRDSPQVPDVPRLGKERLGTDVEQERERSGTVRNGTGAGARDETTGEAGTALLRAGLNPAIVGGRSA